jgi:hypothetical protein
MISGNIDKFNSPLRQISGKVELFTEGSAFIRDITHDGDLISFEVDRVGEGKFFGYGVCQKVEVKIRDKNRQYNISDGYVRPGFDDMTVLPLFHIKEVKRDENTNELTITAYDAIEEANKHTISELSIDGFTLGDIAYFIAEAIGVDGVKFDVSTFDYLFEPNIEGTETFREILDDIAEATQTIYFINYENKLEFKWLCIADDSVYDIDKSKYFTLAAEAPITLSAVASVTELGDNVQVGEGTVQYIRDNVFWALVEEVAGFVDEAWMVLDGLTITPFDCSWRGNYLVEIGDKISLTTKDDNIIYTFLLNDKLTYNGGFKQHSQWAYDAGEETAANPTTLGEAIKQTYARVDKANRQINLVASEVSVNDSKIAEIMLTVDGINNSVSSFNKKIDDVSGQVEEVKKSVSSKMTDEEILFEINKSIENGVSKVETSTGFTFNEEGLTVSKSNSEISTQITEDGMTVSKNDEVLLKANNEGVEAIDLKATTFLIIGDNSRFEDMGSNRTACFWIGG